MAEGKGHRKKKSGRKAEKRKGAESKKKNLSDEQVRCLHALRRCGGGLFAMATPGTYQLSSPPPHTGDHRAGAQAEPQGLRLCGAGAGQAGAHAHRGEEPEAHAR